MNHPEIIANLFETYRPMPAHMAHVEVSAALVVNETQRALKCGGEYKPYRRALECFLRLVSEVQDIQWAEDGKQERAFPCVLIAEIVHRSSLCLSRSACSRSTLHLNEQNANVLVRQLRAISDKLATEIGDPEYRLAHLVAVAILSALSMAVDSPWRTFPRNTPVRN